MASGFHGDHACDEPGCHASSSGGLTYNVVMKEKKKFCKKCAAKNRDCVRKVRMAELGMFCEKHDKPVRLHCKHHDAAACQLCGLIDHRDPPCKLQDIDKAIAIKKCELRNLQKESKDKASSFKQLRERLGKCTAKADEQLQLVEQHFTSIIDDEIAMIYMNGQNEALEINEEADAEIRKINEKRKDRLGKCQENVEKRRHLIESRRSELLDDVKDIAHKTQTRLTELETDATEVLQAFDDGVRRMEILLEDEKKLLKEAGQLKSSLADHLRKTADTDVIECISRTLRGVRFVEGAGKERYNGRIGGYDGIWELNSAVPIPSDIKCLVLVGCTSNDGIIMSAVNKGELHTYTFDLKNKTSKRVVTSADKTFISSCALLGEDMIVCGKYSTRTGDNLSGYISLYDRGWQLVKDIAIPSNASGDRAWVYVAVDRDGMIIASELGQKLIYVIDPGTGNIVNTLTCTEDVGGPCSVLSSGEIVAQPYSCSNKLLIINRQGGQREITHSGNILDCGIDPLTDDLFVVWWDEGRKMAVMDQLSGEGHQERTEVIAFPSTYPSAGQRCPMITPSGQIIISNDNECLVCRSVFNLGL